MKMEIEKFRTRSSSPFSSRTLIESTEFQAGSQNQSTLSLVILSKVHLTDKLETEEAVLALRKQEAAKHAGRLEVEKYWSFLICRQREILARSPDKPCRYTPKSAACMVE